MEMIFDPQYRSIVIFLMIIAVAVIVGLITRWRLKRRMNELQEYNSPFMPRNKQAPEKQSLDFTKKKGI